MTWVARTLTIVTRWRLCTSEFLKFGLEAAGKIVAIPDDAIAWVGPCACQKPKEVGYSFELWTYALLQRHVRTQGDEAGHPRLVELSRSKLHRIFTQGEIQPHKIRYYVERRDPEVAPKMVTVLHAYKEVEIVNAGIAAGTLKEPAVVTISSDEKPGIPALATTTPDRPPKPKKYQSHRRDSEDERLGTVSLLAGLDHLAEPASPAVRVCLHPSTAPG